MKYVYQSQQKISWTVKLIPISFLCKLGHLLLEKIESHALSLFNSSSHLACFFPKHTEYERKRKRERDEETSYQKQFSWKRTMFSISIYNKKINKKIRRPKTNRVCCICGKGSKFLSCTTNECLEEMAITGYCQFIMHCSNPPTFRKTSTCQYPVDSRLDFRVVSRLVSLWGPHLLLVSPLSLVISFPFFCLR